METSTTRASLTARYTQQATYAQQSPQSTSTSHQQRGFNKKTTKRGVLTLKIPYASTAYTPKRAHSPLVTILRQYAIERARPHSVPYVPSTAPNDVGGCSRSAVYTCLSTSRATDKLYWTGCWYAAYHTHTHTSSSSASLPRFQTHSQARETYSQEALRDACQVDLGRCARTLRRARRRLRLRRTHLVLFFVRLRLRRCLLGMMTRRRDGVVRSCGAHVRFAVLSGAYFLCEFLRSYFFVSRVFDACARGEKRGDDRGRRRGCRRSRWGLMTRRVKFRVGN